LATYAANPSLAKVTLVEACPAIALPYINTRLIPERRKMFSFRRSLIAAAASVLLSIVATDEAGSQTANSYERETPAEMARAIAHAINTNTPKTTNVRIAFVSATSHDNIVEVHYMAKDARFFPHNDAERDERRLGQAGYFCFNSRISLFRKSGVVIHQILAAPDSSASFEITIDQSTCATLIADAKIRAESAEQKRSDSTRSATGLDSLAEPKRVRTMTIRPDHAEQK
jgi:hypothetical protein